MPGRPVLRRSRPGFTGLVLVVIAALAAGCAQAPPDSQALEGGTVTTPQPLWERIIEDDYAGWKVAPGYQLPQPSEGMAHGKRVQIFLNDTAAVAREQAAREWPDGSILVTDVLDEHSIVRVAAMEKRGGSWYFAEWSPDGRALPPREPGCTSCHSSGTDGTLGVRIGR